MYTYTWSRAARLGKACPCPCNIICTRFNQCKEVEEVGLDKGDLFDFVAVMNHAGGGEDFLGFFLSWSISTMY